MRAESMVAAGSSGLEPLALALVAFAAGLLEAGALLEARIRRVIAKVRQHLVEQLPQLIPEFRVREDVEAILPHGLDHARGYHIRLHAELVDFGQALDLVAIDGLGLAFERLRPDVVA